jgi:hypothetical protein
MSDYPDLLACGMTFMQFKFHVSDGLASLDAFWEKHGYERSSEPLMFAGYSRDGHDHTVYAQWLRSHDNCANVYVGIDARRPSQVWPNRKTNEHRLRQRDFRSFIDHVSHLDIYSGIRARYGYPSEEGLKGIVRLPNVRPVSVTFELLDEKQKPAMYVSYEKRKTGWVVIVEPRDSFPFPKGKNFFQQPYALGCSLAPAFMRSSNEQRQELPE